LRRGIEPIIAVVILVAVTLVIAIGVIGWIMGWWGTFGATEALQFYPDSYITSDGTLYLHVKNMGSAAAVIYKVEVTGIATNTSNLPTISPGTENTYTIKVPPQSSGVSYIPGTTYQVKIYTKAGNVYSVTVQAKA
jgi:flagellin-like protein